MIFVELHLEIPVPNGMGAGGFRTVGLPIVPSPGQRIEFTHSKTLQGYGVLVKHVLLYANSPQITIYCIDFGDHSETLNYDFYVREKPGRKLVKIEDPATDERMAGATLTFWRLDEVIPFLQDDGWQFGAAQS